MPEGEGPHPGRHDRHPAARRAAARLRLRPSPAGAVVRRRARCTAGARGLQPRDAAAPARDLLPAAVRLVRGARHRPVRAPPVDGRPGLRALLPDPRAGCHCRHDPSRQARFDRRTRVGAGEVRLLVDGSPGPPAVQRGIPRRLRPHADLRADEMADRLVPGAGDQPAVPARVLLLGARPPRERGAARRRTQQSLVGPLPALRRLLPAAVLRKHRRPAGLRRGDSGRRLLRAVAGGARPVHAPARLQLPGGPPPVGGRAGRRRRHPAGRHALPRTDRRRLRRRPEPSAGTRRRAPAPAGTRPAASSAGPTTALRTAT